MVDSADPSSFVAPVAELISSLTAADGEHGALAVVAAHLQRWRLAAAELVLVTPDADGRPRDPHVVAAWREGHVLTDTPEIPDLPASTWSSPAAPIYTTDPAVAVLPLHNPGHGGWLGALRLTWTDAHVFAADERAVHVLVTAVVAAHLGGLRTQQRLRAALAERELLHEVSRQLGLTLSLDERLRVLVKPAPAPDEAEVVLCSFECDEAGAPTWLTVISILPAAGTTPLAEMGARYHLPSIPFANLYVSNPDEPLLISDIQTDPRVDDDSRRTYAHNGVRSTIILSLTLNGRWVGMLNIGWTRPHALGERERRLYQSLARQAALLLDHSLMVDRQRTMLQDSLRQGQLLQTVLDHIPVGVLLLEAPSARPLLTNPAATRLLGPQIYAQTEPPPDVPYTVVFPGTDRRIPVDQLVGVRAAVTGQAGAEPIDVVTPGRERRHLDAAAVPMRDDHGIVKNVLMVLTDITARKRAEDERVRLHDEVVRVQAAALAERGAPIIPITDDILVLPIIGSLDHERGQQILTAILAGASQRRARVVILDITGVGAVDTQAAAALTTAAQALRLLGVEPVLSGIRPDVAQALIHLGVRLEGITTCGTLQSSIQYALHHLGRASLA